MTNVLITGSSSGIGAATVLLLDRQGVNVFAGVEGPDDGQQSLAGAIFLAVWLIQRGSPESKKPGEAGTESDADHGPDLGGYVATPDFWDRTPAEPKPVGSPHSATGVEG